MKKTRPMKLSDLAVLAGVSTATVSRALAGSDLIGADTRARIRALAAEHGVRPNQQARNFRLRSTGAIGLVLPLGHARLQHLSDPFFLQLMGELADRLVEHDYDIMLSRVIPADEDWLDKLVDGGRVDGVLLIGQSDQTATIDRVARHYPPLVVWGAARPDHAHLTVGSDNRAGGALAARHFSAGGRRRLAFVGDPLLPEFADRLDGFRDGAGESGLAVELLDTAMEPVAVHDRMVARLRHAPPPDAIFAVSDQIAVTVLRALAEAGLAVPDDVAVIGYDDVALAAHTSPPLTTVRQDLQRGAALMVEALLARIAGREAASTLLAPELIVRRSA